MFGKIEWFIAMRYLKTKRKESFINIISWFSLIGITLGVAVLIIVMSVMNGFRKDLISSIVGIDGHISISNPYNSFINNYSDILNNLKNIRNIDHTGVNITTQSLINSKYYSTGVIAKGVNLSDLLKRKIKFDQKTKNGFLEFDKGEKVLFIGGILARSLGVGLKDNIRAIFPQTDSTITGLIPKYINFKVVGIFNTGMYQYDSNMIFVPFKIAQLLYDTKGAQSIEVFIKDPDKVDSVREQIHAKIGDNFYITTWKENNFSLINALDTERNVMFIILILIIMIATFNVMSSLIMLVRSKTKEIAILKTMGFNKGNIQKIFFIIGFRTGIIGTLLGSVLGISFSLNIEEIRIFLQNILHINLFNENVYFLSHIPAYVSFTQVFIIVVLSLFLSIIASIYPSRRAARIITAEALRYE